MHALSKHRIRTIKIVPIFVPIPFLLNRCMNEEMNAIYMTLRNLIKALTVYVVNYCCEVLDIGLVIMHFNIVELNIGKHY